MCFKANFQVWEQGHYFHFTSRLEGEPHSDLLPQTHPTQPHPILQLRMGLLMSMWEYTPPPRRIEQFAASLWKRNKQLAPFQFPVVVKRRVAVYFPWMFELQVFWDGIWMFVFVLVFNWPRTSYPKVVAIVSTKSLQSLVVRRRRKREEIRREEAEQEKESVSYQSIFKSKKMVVTPLCVQNFWMLSFCVFYCFNFCL